MKEENILEVLCKGSAPSGREFWMYTIIQNIFKEFGEICISNLNNIYIKKKGKNKGKIMIMAHIDEVFLMVTEVLKNGFLKFKANGIDLKTLISQEVVIHGKKKIWGVVQSSNLYSTNNKKFSINDDIFIDTGYTDDTINSLVSVGDYVTLKRDFYELLNNNVACKAIDDRAGIMSMYYCAKELININHDFDVYFVCSSQEEVGHRGAKSAAYEINPDVAIAVDVTFDSGIFGDSDRENKLGKGPVICIGPNIHPKIRKKVMNLAKEYNISYQIEVEPGNTGTDAWDIQIARRGIPTLLISIPIKYMHTSVEMINMDDIKNTGILIAKFIEKIKMDELEELLCY